MKRLNEWKCKKCSVAVNTVDNSDDTEIESESYDVENLNDNVNVTDINLDKYNRILFNPLQFENMSKESEANDENILKNECMYVTFKQLSQNISNQQADLTLFNLNIRSLNKKKL